MTQEDLNMETPPVTEEGTQLIAIDALKAKEVFSEKGVPALIEKVKKHVKEATKLDPNTPEGREERRSLAYKIARTKTGVDNIGKDYVGELKKITTAIDSRRKHWRDTMDDIQAAVRQPLTEYETKEKERIGGHQTAIQQMRDLMAYDYEPTSEDVEKRIAQIEVINQRDFEEFKEQAQTVADNASGRLSEKLAAVIKAEHDAKELEELRQAKIEQDKKDNEERIRQEERDRIAAANAKPQTTPAAPVESVPEQAQGTLVESAIDKTTQVYGHTRTTADDEERERKRQVNMKIAQHLVDSCMLSENAAKAVVIEIARGNVPNTTINY